MLQTALDFKSESDNLYQTLCHLADKDFEQITQFKNWTINNVIQHLHFFNWAAHLSIKDEQAFRKLTEDLKESRAADETMVRYTERNLDGVKGQNLLQLWQNLYSEMSDVLKLTEPKKRVQWFGPDMSVLSSVTARLMETWAHGLDIYDTLGIARKENDYIRNIVVLGNNTFAWSFLNRGEQAPKNKPFLQLVAPSGGIWNFNKPSTANFIAGSAAEFCQVVTQTRNIQDTSLNVKGSNAAYWMSIAQCFAGPPRTPPLPRTRYCEIK